MGAYRIREGVPLLLVKDRTGGVCYHWGPGCSVGVGGFGPDIPWLSDEQTAHFLRLGLVEKIDGDLPETLAIRPADWSR
jgi:hypothetical protein